MLNSCKKGIFFNNSASFVCIRLYGYFFFWFFVLWLVDDDLARFLVFVVELLVFMTSNLADYVLDARLKFNVCHFLVCLWAYRNKWMWSFCFGNLFDFVRNEFSFEFNECWNCITLTSLLSSIDFIVFLYRVGYVMYCYRWSFIGLKCCNCDKLLFWIYLLWLINYYYGFEFEWLRVNWMLYNLMFVVFVSWSPYVPRRHKQL